MNTIKSTTEQKGNNYLVDIAIPLTAELENSWTVQLIFSCDTGKLNENGWHCIHIAEKDWWTGTKSKVSANIVGGSAWDTESPFASIGNSTHWTFTSRK